MGLLNASIRITFDYGQIAKLIGLGVLSADASSPADLASAVYALLETNGSNDNNSQRISMAA